MNDADIEKLTAFIDAMTADLKLFSMAMNDASKLDIARQASEAARLKGGAYCATTPKPGRDQITIELQDNAFDARLKAELPRIADLIFGDHVKVVQ